MAHGPSPFGVPQQAGQGNQHEPGFDWDEYDERARMNAPTVRLSEEERAQLALDATRSPEEEMEAHLESIQASRPLRRAAQRARRRTKWWLVALAVVSGLAVAAACTAGAFIVLREGEQDPEAPNAGAADQESSVDDASGAPEVVDPIASRETDAAPFTAEELFGAGPLAPAGAAGTYEVLQTEELTDCAEAALDELADLLADADCTQAARATIVNPDGEYAATAGVLNLATAEEAEAIRAAIASDLDGGFAVLRTDGDAAELGRADTQLGYNTYGHYLMFVVIGRTDGEALTEANDAVRTVVGDVLDIWFVDRLSPRREVQ